MGFISTQNSLLIPVLRNGPFKIIEIAKSKLIFTVLEEIPLLDILGTYTLCNAGIELPF